MTSSTHLLFDNDVARVELEAQALSLAYGRHEAVHALSLRVPPGRITAIVGANGCGKSTLLQGLARLHAPRAGSVLLDGRDLARTGTREVARLLAVLPQDVGAPEGMTVAELIRFGRQPHQGLLRQWSDEDQAVVDAAIAAADLDGLADRPLASMSGGQRQRAWIAMTIAQATPLLLLDEPTSALDLGHQVEVFELIRALAAAGKTIVMVVHDLAAACRYADYMVAMQDGRIVAEGLPRAIVTPALVRTLYGVDCTLLQDPVSGTPVITGVTRVRA